MKLWLHEDREIFKESITLTAEYKKLPEDAVLRDYYITLLLDNLSKSKYKELCVFKGGTSLSKCYPGTINRFSEDIDLTYIDTEGKKGKAISKQIKEIEAIMSAGFETEPIAKERSDYSKSMNVWNIKEGKDTSVKLEIGAKIHPMPIVTKQLTSYIHEFLLSIENDDILDNYYFPTVELSVLDITRTFIDKVYAVKTRTIVGDIDVKVRHIYDVVQLYGHTEIKNLLKDTSKLKVIVRYAIDATKFYVTKRNIQPNEKLDGAYNFSEWKQRLVHPSVRLAYESLHNDLLYTTEKQSFDLAIEIFESLDGILSGLNLTEETLN